MTFAFMSEPINHVSEVSVIRESANKIRINTVNVLTDSQVEDLYWATIAMHRTGKTLRELLKSEDVQAEVHG